MVAPSIRDEPRPAAKRLPAYGPRAFRKLVGLPLAVVAQRSGYSVATVRRIEAEYLRVAAGDRSVLLAPPATAERIAWAMRCDDFPDGAPVDIFYRFESISGVQNAAENKPRCGRGFPSGPAEPPQRLRGASPHTTRQEALHRG